MAPLDEDFDAEVVIAPLDLTDLRFMDSAGLVGAAAKTTVIVRNPSVIVRRVIEATGLAAVLNMETDS
jgi:anti-anti-sigma factor